MKNKVFDYSFLTLGLLIQVVTYGLGTQLSAVSSQLSVISLVSGCLGVCSVCLTAQRNIFMYVFGFAQIGTYTYLCLAQRFYGETAINIYYFCTMIYGVFVWRKNLQTNSSHSAGENHCITTRRLRWYVLLIIAIGTLLFSWLAGMALSAWTDDTQPYLDAFTTVPALVAQVLMILVYCEHWYLWLAVDILSIVMWLRAGDYCIVAQYAFWCANCIYGLYKWKKAQI